MSTSGGPKDEAEVDPVLADWVAELADRFQCGAPLDLDEFARRDPGRTVELRQMLLAIAMMADLAESPERAEGRAGAAPGGLHPYVELDQLGDYRIVREVGRGGMGIVYEAQQISLNRRVALKVLPFVSALDPRQLKRFEIEALAAAGLYHPHIVPVYAVGYEGGVPYYSMQFIEGQSLADVIRGARDRRRREPRRERTAGAAQGGDGSRPAHPQPSEGSAQAGAVPWAVPALAGKDPARLAAEFGLQASEALEHAHRNGVLHRDIKPSNLLIDRAGCLWVTDFGLARVLGETNLTNTGDLLGTLRYMSPEQVRGRNAEIDRRTDIYSLGATLYELLTLEQAFMGDDRQELQRRISLEEPRPPRRVNPEIPADLETIVLRAMAKEPADRYPTAQALAEDLRRFLARRPILARRPGALGRWVRWAKRRQRAAAAVAATLVAVAVVTTAIALLSNAWLRRHNDLLRRALDRADSLASEARAQRAKAERSEWLARRHLYASRLRLARAEWGVAHVERAQELLYEMRPEPGAPDPREFAWHYLWRLTQREVTLLWAHRAAVYAVAVSPDGKTIASGDVQGKVILWDLVPGPPRAVLTGHSQATVHRLAFSPDGRTLATGAAEPSRPGEVCLWDVPTARLVARLPGRRRAVELLQFAPDGATLACRGLGDADRCDLELWDLAGGRDCPSLRETLRGVDAVTFSPDRRHWATAHREGKIVLRDSASGGRPVLPGRGSASRLTFSPDGRTLAAALTSGGVGLWDVREGRDCSPHEQPAAPVPFVAFGLGGSALVEYSDQSNLLTIVNFLNRSCEQKKVAGRLAAIAVSPGGRSLAAGGDQQQATLWDLTGGRGPLTYRGRMRGVHALAFTPDGRSVVLGCEDPAVRVWHLGGDARPDRVAGHDAEVWALAFTRDGTTLASAGDDHTVKLWDPASGRLRATLRGHGQLVTSLAASPDGRVLASGGFDRAVRLWELPDGRPLPTLTGHTDVVRAVAFSPFGDEVASASSDRTVRIWELGTGRQRLVLRGHSDVVRAVAFAPGGPFLASGANDRTVRIWDPFSGAEIKTLDCPNVVVAVAFSPDGASLAAADEKGAITVWAVGSWSPRLTIKGPEAEVRCLAFSPDDRTLAAGYSDRSVRLWDPLTGQDLLLLEGHSNTVGALAFSPDGRTLASGGFDGAVRLWHADPD
jgi:WD40 repeat protein/serine/threonine protein kinase